MRSTLCALGAVGAMALGFGLPAVASAADVAAQNAQIDAHANEIGGFMLEDSAVTAPPDGAPSCTGLCTSLVTDERSASTAAEWNSAERAALEREVITARLKAGTLLTLEELGPIAAVHASGMIGWWIGTQARPLFWAMHVPTAISGGQVGITNWYPVHPGEELAAISDFDELDAWPSPGYGYTASMTDNSNWIDYNGCNGTTAPTWPEVAGAPVTWHILTVSQYRDGGCINNNFAPFTMVTHQLVNFLELSPVAPQPSNIYGATEMNSPSSPRGRDLSIKSWTSWRDSVINDIKSHPDDYPMLRAWLSTTISDEPNMLNVGDAVLNPSEATSNLADIIIAKSTDPVTQVSPLTRPQAIAVATVCRALMNLMPGGTDGDCANKRLFITGYDDQEPANHDLDAIFRFPLWVGLNWEGSKAKKTWTSRTWYNNAPFTAQCDRDNPPSDVTTPLDCDEYPLFSTEQGGAWASKTTGRDPSLKLVNSDQNRHQGTQLWNTLARICMRPGTPRVPEQLNSTGGSSFLSLPMPPMPDGYGVPTLGLCNGNTFESP